LLQALSLLEIFFAVLQALLSPFVPQKVHLHREAEKYSTVHLVFH